MEPKQKELYQIVRGNTSSVSEGTLFDVPDTVLKDVPKSRATNEGIVTVSEDLNFDYVTDVQISELLAELGEAKKEKIIKVLKDSNIIKRGFLGISPTVDLVGLVRFSSAFFSVLKGWDDRTKKELVTAIENSVKYQVCHRVRWDLVLARYLSPNVDYTFTISSVTGMKEANLCALTTTLATQTVSKFVTEVKAGIEFGAEGIGKATTTALSRSELQQQISRTLRSELSRQIELSEQSEFTETISCRTQEPGLYSVWQLVDIIEVNRVQCPVFYKSDYSKINEFLRPGLIARGETKAQIIINSMSSLGRM